MASAGGPGLIELFSHRLLRWGGTLLLLLTSACGSPTSSPARSPVPPSPASPSAAAASVGPSPAASVAIGTTSSPTVPRGPWIPSRRTAWQWQLTTPVDQSVDVPVYDIDLFDNAASVVASLHAKGRRVICYVEVGGVESYRADAGRFPTSVQGKTVDGYPKERWLDVRQIGVLEPILASRFDQCTAKGFDAVEPDLLDGYANDSGFPLSAGDQLAFDRMIAGLAHARGLSVALKNDLDQVPELVGSFDFALDEQCVEFSECDQLLPFTRAGKAVLHVEYNLPTSRFCPITAGLGFSSMLKHLSLDAFRRPC